MIHLEKGSFALLTVILHICSHATGQQCGDLIPGNSTILSETIGWVGDPPVTVTCADGHVLDTGEIQKNITCNITDGSDATWSDVVGDCERKQCLNITSMLGSNMHLIDTTPPSISRYGDKIILECDADYAFDVDHASPVWERVTSQKEISCIDDSESPFAIWEDLGDCYPIPCSTPPTVPNSLQEYTSVTINSTVIYKCLSGTGFSVTQFIRIATCNSSAEWSLPNDVTLANLNCAKLNHYVGCLSSGSMVLPIQTVSNDNGVTFCVQYCKDQNKGLAGVNDDTCYCDDVLIDNFIVETDDTCNQTCPGYDGSSLQQQVFCGGSGGQIAVYATLHGCYDLSSITAEGSEDIVGTNRVTCNERCRGQDYLHAASQNPSTCHCFNESQSAASVALNSYCGNESYTDVVYITNLARSRPEAETCQDLYQEGIRMNGDYYLKTGKVNCVFYDNTLCEPEWIGYDGFCYYFNSTTVMNFNNSREFCRSVDADLVSIATQEEYNFLRDTRNYHADLWANKNIRTWWLGLIDNANNLLYSWVDGSLMTFLKFKSTPEDEYVACAVDTSQHSYEWLEAECNHEHNVMCKKPAVGSRCIQSGHTDANVSKSFSTMSVTYCTQFCKGKQLKYAVFENTTCQCMDDLPSIIEINVTECNSPCGGHEYQFCGGEADDTHSVVDASMMMSAVSCEELHLYGIDNNTFHLQINSTTDMYAECGVSACPHSWILLNGVCYKYSLLSRKIKEAFVICAREDSYMVSIENESEVELLMLAAHNISLYKSIPNWRLGLVSQGLNGGVYRWPNGKMIDLAYWNNSVIGERGLVAVSSADSSLWSALTAASDKTQFICEKGLEYIGCYKIDGLTSSVSIQNYSAMTVQQCVELCRANSKKYSYLRISSCVCEDYLTTEESGACLSECEGQKNQVCGGADVMSVYDTYMYPVYDSCSELFDAGIFISGTYYISGTLQECVFTDSTVCNRTGWIGIEGNCFLHFPNNDLTRWENCFQNNAVQTSLVSVGEFSTLLSYSRRVDLFGKRARIFTGIEHGGYNMDVFISEDGFLVEESLLGTSGPLKISDLYDDYGYISFYADNEKQFTNDGGIICKEDKYRIGCYDKPHGLLTILDSFGSMELGMCRQLCLNYGDEITLMGNDFCACASNLAVVSTFSMTTSNECYVQCSLHSGQLCGNGSIMWAYNTTVYDTRSYPRSCEHLYQNGIFYNTTYTLRNENNSLVDQQCGFTDDTTCEVTWLGLNGSCFKVHKTHNDFNTSLFNCIVSDSYLFNPVDSWVMNFVQSFVTTSGLLNDESTWMTGIESVFYNISYVMSSGHIIEEYHVTNSIMSSSVIALDISTMTWIDNDLITPQPAICQRDPDYLGCYSIVTTPDATYENNAGNSLTQCMYWCKGSNFSYAAVHQRECRCFHDNPVMTSAKGQCDIICESVTSQMCGGLDAGTNKLYTVANITNLQAVVSSCQDLFIHGVFMPGWYYLRDNVVLQSVVSVLCFSYPPLLEFQSLLGAEVKSITGSSTLSGHSVDNIKIVYPYTLAWKPGTDDISQFVKIVMEDAYLVTGIIISGLHTLEEQSYITSFRLQYRDLITGQLDDYLENSDNELSSNCNTSAVLCFRFLANPMVTNEIHLYPVTWYNSVSLQVAFAGELFSNFNHSDTYIGCMLDLEDSFKNAGVVNDIHACRNICKSEFVPFASIDVSSTCWCGHSDFKYGFVNESECPTQGSQQVGAGPYRAIHRTYPDRKATQDAVYDPVGESDEIGAELDDMETMERVTLGVVGDPFVGKTMLSVSYTANYVFKEYIPTVLNYYTTTTRMEGRVIDILIWDNSGSDEYADLRPLSYPQTDAFLLCFSLKSRESLENVLAKWLPEIDENVHGRVPIVLVGCKRDKNCGPADDLLANGHMARVTPTTDRIGLYPYMAKVHFDCDQGYEHSPDIPDIEIECLQTNEWSEFTHNCTKIQCANFTVENADVVIDSLEYLGKATVTCQSEYFTDYGRSQVDVYCQSDKTWSEELTCKEGHRSNYYRLHHGKTRVAQGIEQQVRSQVDCAAKCTLNKLCTGANYQNDPTNNDKYFCTLFEEPYTDEDLQSDSSCIYLEIS